MCKFLKQDIFDEYRTTLSNIFLAKDNQMAISRSAGLDVAKITFSDQSMMSWDSLLSRAEVEGKVLEVLMVCDRDIGGNDKIREYIEEVRNGISFEQLLSQDNAVFGTGEGGKLLVLYDTADRKNCMELQKQFYLFEGSLNILAMEGGESSPEQMLGFIEQSEIVMPIISPDFFRPTNDFVRSLHTAVEKEKKIIPVLMARCLYGRVKVLKNYLSIPIDGTFIQDLRDEESGYFQVAVAMENLLNQLNES